MLQKAALYDDLTATSSVCLTGLARTVLFRRSQSFSLVLIVQLAVFVY
jgi:hypothetical protein